MKSIILPKKTFTLSVIALIIGSWTMFPALAGATGGTSKSTTSSSTSSTSSTNQQHLQNIITKGNAEINRRLALLDKLSAQITSTTKLTSADQADLESEVNTEISGLKALETQLDSETQLSSAIQDAENIISEYRVYALVLPKVWLIKTADAQQTTESKLSTFAQKLQTRLTAEQTAGQNVSSLQADLTTMNSDISSAQTISTSIEQNVLPLQPSDYDTDHTILSGDASQLQTAHADNVSAYNQAKTIVSGIESLK